MSMKTVKIGIILGSTRQGRTSPQVGQWVKTVAEHQEDTAFEIIDLAEYDLPFFGTTEMNDERIIKWNQTLDSYDGFIFIVQEYNHSITGALKNALDLAREPWNNKAAGIVSYGAVGGARAAEHLRGILGELAIADVRTHPALSVFTDFADPSTFKPADLHIPVVEKMVSEVVSWSRALQTVRSK